MPLTHLIDFRLCTPSTTCDTLGCQSFSLNVDGTCGSSTNATAPSSSWVGNSAEGTLYIWEDQNCTVPFSLPSIPMVLDGACHTEDGALAYTAAARRTCLAPDPFGSTYYNLAAMSASRFNDMGNYDACMMYTDFKHCALQGHTPVDGLYTGFCVPVDCTAADLTTAGSSINSWMAQQVGSATALTELAGLFSYEFSQPDVTVRCGDQSYQWDSNAALTAGSLVLCAALVLAATLFSLMYPKAKEAKGKRRSGSGSGAAQGLRAGALELVHSISLCSTGRRVFCLAPQQPPPPPPPSAPPRLNLAALDGVRVLSLSLVILGHAFFFPDALTGYSNTAVDFSPIGVLLAAPAMQVIPSAEFAVDTFFLLSGALGGLLLTRGMRKALEKAMGSSSAAHPAAAALPLTQQEGSAAPLLSRSLNDEGSSEAGAEGSAGGGAGGAAGSPARRHLCCPPPSPQALLQGAAACALTWLYSILHRWLRLLPSVGLLIAVTMYLVPLLGYGPFWRYGMQGSIEACRDHGWSNLLFLNNVYPRAPVEGRFDNMCVGWTWYLAVDFQLHAIALPPLALLAALSPLLAAPALLAALAGTIGWGAQQVVRQSLTPLVLGAPPSLGGDASDYFYDTSLTRAPAFLVGVGLGWAMMLWEEGQTPGQEPKAQQEQQQQQQQDHQQQQFAAEGAEGSAEEEAAAAPGSPADCTEDAGQRFLRAVLLPLLPRRRSGGLHVLATAALAAALLLLGLLFYLPTSAYAAGASANGWTEAAGPPLWSIAAQQWYMAVSRPLWALGCAVLLYACATGVGGGLAWALGAPMWRPLAAIAFQAYLYHPVVLNVLGYNVASQPRYSPAFLAEHYAATCVLTSVLAGAVYCVVEAPFAALERLALAQGGRAAQWLLAQGGALAAGARLQRSRGGGLLLSWHGGLVDGA